MLASNQTPYKAKGKAALFALAKKVQAHKTDVDEVILSFPLLGLGSTDEEKNTLLHHIAKSGNVSLINRLIDKGLLIKKKNNKQLTAFVVAAEANQWEIVKTLISRSPYMRLTTDNEVAIHYAILDNRVDMVEALIADFVTQVVDKEEGLNLGNARFDINPKHLLTAVNKKHWGCVLVLAKHCKLTSESGHLEALVCAIEDNQMEVVIALLEKGCLDCLISSNHIISIDSLLEKVNLTGNSLLKKLMGDLIKTKDQKAREILIKEAKHSIENTKAGLIYLFRVSCNPSSFLHDRGEDERLNLSHLPVEVMDLIIKRVADESGIKNPPGVTVSDRVYLNLVKTFCTKESSRINSLEFFKKINLIGTNKQILIEKLQGILHKNLSVKNKIIELKAEIDDFVQNKGQKNGGTLYLLNQYELIGSSVHQESASSNKM